ncbi:MAG: hypothetical protein N2572_02255 [Syntrophales bacterium]|nr:hypothetical protein [Syntrophales bacterium]
MRKRVVMILRTTIFVQIIIGLTATLALAKGAKEKGTYIAPTITAEQALSTVKSALPKLTVGNSYVKTGKRGEKNLEVPLIYEGNIVARIRLNPATGEILPKGFETDVNSVSASPEQSVKIVQQALPNMDAASVSLGKHGEWKVGLILKKAVIAHIKVNGQTGSILPDWKAARDASLYSSPSR